MTAQRNVAVVEGVVETAAHAPAKLRVNADNELLVAVNGGGGGGTVTQGPAGNIAAPWYVRIIDGASTAIGVALDSTLQALRDRFPAAAALSNSLANPTTTIVGAALLARYEDTGEYRRVKIDSSQRLEVTAHTVNPSTFSRSSGTYEEQRGIDNAFGLSRLQVFSDAAGYVLTVNKSSDAANADLPYGANVFPVQANQLIQVDFAGAQQNHTSGCQVCFSSTPNVVTLAGAHLLIEIAGD